MVRRRALLILLTGGTLSLGSCGAGTESPPPGGAGEPPLGMAVDDLLPREWLTRPVAVGTPDGPKATLVRFWTDTCPFCERSLPAVESLRREFAGQGLETVAVYHPKPPRPVPAATILTRARELGYEGPVAVDERWRALRRIWLDTGQRAATSASFLLDGAGVVRFVHSGPEFHPSEDPGHTACARDFEVLRGAIAGLLLDK